MDGNKDEALKCLAIAQRHFDSGNLPSAKRFCQKSISLYPTEGATKLLSAIAEVADSSSGTSSTYSNSSPQDSSSAPKKRRGTPVPETSSGPEKRDYTPENEANVRLVRSCKITEYYKILGLEKDCDESDVKRAYRKLALQLHPDKNGAPGADEAFKLVSKAFQILSDPQKRAAYDQHGADPESRMGNMAGAGGSFQNPTFEGEMTPEDLFNMFFGNGPTGSGGFAFGGGPGVFTASFGPGGFRTTRVRTGRGQAPTEASFRTMFTQLAPVILLFLFTILSAVPNMFGKASVPHPRYEFRSTPRFSAERQTGHLNVRYYVNPTEFEAHPIAADLVDSRSRPPSLENFERYVERTYTEMLFGTCRREMEMKERRKEQKSGFLGIGADWDAIREIEAERIASCDELRELGVIS